MPPSEESGPPSTKNWPEKMSKLKPKHLENLREGGVPEEVVQRVGKMYDEEIKRLTQS